MKITGHRYEKMKNELEEMRGLLEHISIHGVVTKRKKSSEKKISLEKLKTKYDL